MQILNTQRKGLFCRFTELSMQAWENIIPENIGIQAKYQIMDKLNSCITEKVQPVYLENYEECEMEHENIDLDLNRHLFFYKRADTQSLSSSL